MRFVFLLLFSLITFSDFVDCLVSFPLSALVGRVRLGREKGFSIHVISRRELLERTWRERKGSSVVLR